MDDDLLDDDDDDLDIGDESSGLYREVEIREQDRYLPVANIARIMKRLLPPNCKVGKDAKESIQSCVSEFISFITSEASDKCQQERRKTINGDDLLWALTSLGFEKYVEPLKVYLAKYREAARGDKPEKKQYVKRDPPTQQGPPGAPPMQNKPITGHHPHPMSQQLHRPVGPISQNVGGLPGVYKGPGHMNIGGVAGMADRGYVKQEHEAMSSGGLHLSAGRLSHGIAPSNSMLSSSLVMQHQQQQGMGSVNQGMLGHPPGSSIGGHQAHHRLLHHNVVNTGAVPGSGTSMTIPSVGTLPNPILPGVSSINGHWNSSANRPTLPAPPAVSPVPSQLPPSGGTPHTVSSESASFSSNEDHSKRQKLNG